ncbi:MAG: sigma-70 family RNA polymerase sigma factor [Anaerolineae bacterium]
MSFLKNLELPWYDSFMPRTSERIEPAVPKSATPPDPKTTDSTRHASDALYPDDALLIRSCLDGQEEAWNQLVARYRRLVYSIINRFGFAETDCDDIFQNVFVTVFRRLSSLQNESCLTAWLITITQRECQQFRRRARPCDALDETIADTTYVGEGAVHQWERLKLLHEALDRLDPRSQELLMALFLDPQRPSYSEVAARLGMAEGSVAPTRARSLKKLESILVEMGFDF